MADGVVHRIFLIRHGETVDNVAGLYAGIRDSALTNHGVLQAEKLGAHLAQRGAVLTHLFSSDLSRAVKTAESIRVAQPSPSVCLVQCADLREQGFGSGEGVSFKTRPAADRRPKEMAQKAENGTRHGFEGQETKVALAARANRFIDMELMPLLLDKETSHTRTVAIVSHGILLSTLWRALVARQRPRSIDISAHVKQEYGAVDVERPGGWSNTGHLEFEYRALTPDLVNECASQMSADTADNQSSAQSPFALTLCAINSTRHLQSLKRTRGGVGSSKHDDRQTSISNFFVKKQKVAHKS